MKIFFNLVFLFIILLFSKVNAQTILVNNTKLKLTCYVCQKLPQNICDCAGGTIVYFSGMVAEKPNTSTKVKLYFPYNISTTGNNITMKDRLGNTFTFSISDASPLTNQEILSLVKDCGCSSGIGNGDNIFNTSGLIDNENRYVDARPLRSMDFHYDSLGRFSIVNKRSNWLNQITPNNFFNDPLYSGGLFIKDYLNNEQDKAGTSFYVGSGAGSYYDEESYLMIDPLTVDIKATHQFNITSSNSMSLLSSYNLNIESYNLLNLKGAQIKIDDNGNTGNTDDVWTALGNGYGYWSPVAANNLFSGDQFLYQDVQHYGVGDPSFSFYDMGIINLQANNSININTNGNFALTSLDLLSISAINEFRLGTPLYSLKPFGSILQLKDFNAKVEFTDYAFPLTEPTDGTTLVYNIGTHAYEEAAYGGGGSTPHTIYSDDDDLTSDRNVTGQSNTFSLSFDQLSHLVLGGDNYVDIHAPNGPIILTTANDVSIDADNSTEITTTNLFFRTGIYATAEIGAPVTISGNNGVIDYAPFGMPVIEPTNGTGLVYNTTSNAYEETAVDLSVTNEIQDISLSGNDLSITSGSTISLPQYGNVYTYQVANQAAMLALTKSTGSDALIAIRADNMQSYICDANCTPTILGNWQILASPTATNTLILSSNILTSTVSGVAANVNLSGYLDNTDAQTLSYNSGTGNLTITGGNTVAIPTPVTLVAGTGIAIIGSGNPYIIANQFPGNALNLVGAGISAVSGTYPNLTITSTEVDGSTSNELQTLSLAGTDLSISSGNTVSLAGLGGGGADNWGSQVVVTNGTLSGTGILGDVLTVATGGITTTEIANTTIALTDLSSMGASNGQSLLYNGSVWTVATLDPSITNELQTLSYNSGTGALSITSGNTVTIPVPTGNETKVNAGTGISVSGNGTIATPYIVTNTVPDQTVSIVGTGISSVTGTYPNFTVTSTEIDGSITNEIQTLSYNGGTGNLSISGGNTVNIPVTSGGTVTSVSVGNLSPLFTANVTNPATAASVTFTQSTVAANTLFANATAGAAAPIFLHPLLSSSLFSSQGTATTVLHGNAGGNLSFAGVSSSDIIDGTILAADLNQMSATTNQVLTWTGAVWAPATPGGGGGTNILTGNQTASGSYTHTMGTNAITFNGATSPSTGFIYDVDVFEINPYTGSNYFNMGATTYKIGTADTEAGNTINTVMSFGEVGENTGSQDDFSISCNGTGGGTPSFGFFSMNKTGSGAVKFRFGNDLGDPDDMIFFINDLPEYANEAAAIVGGLSQGQLYRTSAGVLMVKL